MIKRYFLLLYYNYFRQILRLFFDSVFGEFFYRCLEHFGEDFNLLRRNCYTSNFALVA